MGCKYPIRIPRRVCDVTKDGLPVVKDNGQTAYYVPCGKCPDCLKRRKNDWYVRIRKEEAFGKHSQILFCAFTFDDDHLPTTKEELSARIRAFKDRLRKRLGYMPVHFLITELGHETQRLHLHGFLFMDHREKYKDVRECWMDGFCWIEPMKTVKAISYSLKYVFKSILDRKLKNPLVGRIYASLHFGESYITERTVWYHFRPQDDYGYNNFITFTSCGKRFKYALPKYYKDKVNRWLGCKKMCDPEVWMRQEEEFNNSIHRKTDAIKALESYAMSYFYHYNLNSKLK